MDWYWTSTVLASNASYAWYVNFGSGTTNATPKTTVNPIRCVRGAPLPGPSLVNHNDGTATDVNTGIMWMTGETASGNWDTALSYCESSGLAGYTDWRLPNVKELDSLADASLVFTMSSTVFTGVHDFYYWASTTFAATPANAWYISASSGYVNNTTVKSTATYYTRCVRGGESGSGAILTITSPVTLGVVLSSPSGINCGTTCFALFPPDAVVGLIALPNIGTPSSWPFLPAWAGDADCADGSVTMNTSKTCTANMTTCINSYIIYLGSIPGPLSNSIQQAYTMAAASDSISIVAVHIQETVDFSLGKNIRLIGGIDCGGTPSAYPFTVISGALTISGGSVEFDQIVLM